MTKFDLKYVDGFPANIDINYPIVVQIKDNEQGVVLYTCSLYGRTSRSFLPLELNDKYKAGIYIM